MDDFIDWSISNCFELADSALSCCHNTSVSTNMHMVVHISVFLSEGTGITYFLFFSCLFSIFAYFGIHLSERGHEV